MATEDHADSKAPSANTTAVAELRELGLTVNLDESVAVRIKAALTIIDGRLMQGFYHRGRNRNSGTVYDHFHEAYHAIAAEIVKADTSDDVLENMIPEMVHAFRLKNQWLPHVHLDLVKRHVLRGPIAEWKGRRMLMSSAFADETRKQVPTPLSDPVRPKQTTECRRAERKALADAYFAGFLEKIKVLDVCWAAGQHYSEWKRWLRDAVKDQSAPDRAFRAILTSGKKPTEYRKQPRPHGWK